MLRSSQILKPGNLWMLAASVALVVTTCGCQESAKVGTRNEKGTLAETGIYIEPAGRVLSLKSKPVAVALSPDKSKILVKDNGSVRLIEVSSEKELGKVSIPGGGSEIGLTWLPDGTHFLFTNTQSNLLLGKVEGSTLTIEKNIALPKPKVGGSSYPQGIISSKTSYTAIVALNRNNEVAKIEVPSGKVLSQTTVSVAPYAVASSPDDATIVAACWGSTPTDSELKDDRHISDASGSKVVVDDRGVVPHGELVIMDSNLFIKGKVEIGRQATSIAFITPTVCAISCANEGTIDIVDTAAMKRVATQRVRGLPTDGASVQPSDVSFDKDSQRLTVSLSGRDGVALFDAKNGKLNQLGVVPTGSYPMASALVGSKLVIATSKGTGPQTSPAPKGGYNVYQFGGTLEFVDLTSTKDLANLTKGYFQRQRPLDSAKKLPFEVDGTMPVEHVVYILKENRTYDQVFGDMPKGDGDPELCTYGAEITPNQHALAEEFGLLDNYYCNGVNSADGHSWAMEGNETNYQERAQGGWTRSYPYGDDPLAISSTGHVWDSVLAAKKSFRNFGEFDTTSEVPDSSYKQIFDDWSNGTNKIAFKQSIGVKRVIEFTNKEFPGWNMDIPDVRRASIFLKELETWKASGKMPNLTIIYLPQDHTAGGTPGDPTPRACVADNDLAVGRVVEAISKSQFWAKTAIFINEDDPQAGFDHVDGHRSTCLVVSPYSKKGAVVSDFYNQTSVIRTMLHIVGAKQLNDNTARSPLMAGAFQAKPDLRPFTARKNRIPVDELNPSRAKTQAQAQMISLSKQLDLSKPDASNDQVLNRILWLAARGSEPYPTNLSGSHANGLIARGLKLIESGDTD